MCDIYISVSTLEKRLDNEVKEKLKHKMQLPFYQAEGAQKQTTGGGGLQLTNKRSGAGGKKF